MPTPTLSGRGSLPRAALTLSTLIPTVVKPHNQFTKWLLPITGFSEFALYVGIKIFSIRQLGFINLASNPLRFADAPS